MSEYQYYEFSAIDRPLSAREMNELRSYSTRAHITPTSFVNDYSWGSFKGDEHAWMERYFDAYLYFANWGTHVVKFRLPSNLLDPAIAAEYCSGDLAFVHEKGGKIILTFVSESEEGSDWVESEGRLSSIISVRAELARGDLRALYLGWLLGAQAGEFDDEEVEPPVPPGLGELSASLESLAEFLRIDRDLLHVAAGTSPSIGDAGLDRNEVRTWISELATKEKDELITSLVVEGDHSLVTGLVRRFLKRRASKTAGLETSRRTVGLLLGAAESCATERKRIEAEERAREKARCEQEAAMARDKHLDSLVGRESRLWGEIDRLIATRQPKGYDQAVRLLIDLRDLDVRRQGGEFRRRLDALRQENMGKPSLIKRLNKAGL